MSENGLHPILWRSFVRTTDSNHSHRIYPNLLKNQTLLGPNQAWVADITYIRIHASFVYLAAILDLYTRKVIGWAISKRIDGELCLAALHMALQQRSPVVGCIHHSDRGVQYARHDYVQLLKDRGLAVSMSAKGNPYDNAFVESFFKTNTVFRRFNLWVLGRTGIHTSVFPSAHVSGAFGVAFGMLRVMPDHAGIGWGLLALACSITLATVYGRYHYFVDAVAGIGMSLFALGIALAWERV